MRWTLLVLAGVACDPDGDVDLGPGTGGGPRAGFAFPLADRSVFSQVVGVDHDPVVHEGLLARSQCVDHAGRPFPSCYDEHDGTDFILDGGFPAMDAGSVAVIAAAEGRVTLARDGNYDRCHATLEGVDCDGHPEVANAVVIAHADGNRTMYWHLQSGSVSVAEGAWVEAGEVLGRVGSSGTSSMPHLHFEVQDPDGQVIDPFAGARSQPESLWCVQDAGDGLPGSCE